MSTDQPRTPAGDPAGGQFAGIDRPEADLDLEPAASDARSLADHLERGGRESAELLERLLQETFGDTAAGTHVVCKPSVTIRGADQGEPEIQLSFSLSFDHDVPLERRFIMTELVRGIVERHQGAQR